MWNPHPSFSFQLQLIAVVAKKNVQSNLVNKNHNKHNDVEARNLQRKKP